MNPLSALPAAALSIAILAAPAVAAPRQNVGFPPSMPLKDRNDIMNAAGYEMTPDGQTVFIHCGSRQTPQNPVVAPIDLTGDGKPEYVVFSERKCPGEAPIPIQTDIVSRRPDGVWQNILSVQGSPKPAEGTTDGWRNLAVTKGTQVVAYAHDPEEMRYATVSSLQARKNLALAAAPRKVPSGVPPTAGWTAPYTMGAVPPGDLAAILTAAGYKRIGGKWTGCDGGSEVHLFDEDSLGGDGPVIDLNGDGQPEVMVYDASSACYGNAGQAFSIVTPVPGGWKLVFASGEGLPLLQATRSKSGWRDIVAAGPGFCHELYRNDGKGYEDLRQVAEMPGGCKR